LKEGDRVTKSGERGSLHAEKKGREGEERREKREFTCGYMR